METLGWTVGGPEGTPTLGAVGTTGAVGAADIGAGTTGIEGVAGTGLGTCAATVGFTSKAGFLHTLENPNAGTAAGGDEARGAYLSLEASARINRRLFCSDSRRASFALKGSTTIEERREYVSVGGPNRSPADG